MLPPLKPKKINELNKKLKWKLRKVTIGPKMIRKKKDERVPETKKDEASVQRMKKK